jgi:hypothetical protein
MSKDSEMKFTTRPAGYTLPNHKGNDAFGGFKFRQSIGNKYEDWKTTEQGKRF